MPAFRRRLANTEQASSPPLYAGLQFVVLSNIEGSLRRGHLDRLVGEVGAGRRVLMRPALIFRETRKNNYSA